jgi:hypothetical protein
MTARNGLRVEKVSGNEKAWIRVTTPQDGSLVAFEDVFYMVRGLVQCETEKYAQSVDEKTWPRWGELLRQLLVNSFAYTGKWNDQSLWDRLAERFDLADSSGRRPEPTRITLSSAAAPCGLTGVWEWDGTPTGECRRPAGHAGPHESADGSWPQVAA